MKGLKISFVLFYVLIGTAPLIWMGLTAFKHQTDATSRIAKYVPAVTDRQAAGYEESNAFAVSGDGFANLGEPRRGGEISFWQCFWSSVIISGFSTVMAVMLGTCCAYGFSRFRVPGSKDWLFFILSTRFMPPLAVVAPVFLMYTELGLTDTHTGLIILYIAFNLSLAVWLMKGFIDDIPKAFEEAALIDGYSRFQAFYKIILPQARTGMAVTAVFCLIASWNELGFAMTLNRGDAVTIPTFFEGMKGRTEGIPWPEVAAGALLFVVPIVVFTILVRKHLLRGVTFGTVKG